MEWSSCVVGQATIAERPPARDLRRADTVGVITFLVVALSGVALVVFGFSHGVGGGTPTPAAAGPARGLPPVTVPANFARNTVALPTQKVTAPIDPESVDAGGYLGIPPDVHRVGVYTGGGKLDGPAVGTVLLAGHVNYVGQGTGAFGRIYALHVGDAVITRGTGGPQGWRITALASYVKTTGLPQTIFTATGGRRLTLVTCGGTLDSRHGNYLSNIVVTAVPVRTIVQS